jgi:uncharacterized protein (DUF433 family)
MDYTKYITITPDKRSGKPRIRNTRMSVTDVLEYLAGGMSPDEIVAEFPDLTLEDIRACLAFAADRERKVAVESIGVSARSLEDVQRRIESAFGIWADRTDLPDDSVEYVRQLRDIRGKFRGKGLMKALTTEKGGESEP